jgi:glycosidase
VGKRPSWPPRRIPEPEFRDTYYPSPDDWQRELIYFLLPDRFDDGRSKNRPPLGNNRDQSPWRAGKRGPFTVQYWNYWAISGRNRFQGGTLRGIADRLDYLRDLGVTTIWLAPVWRQRAAGVDANQCGDGSDDPYYPPQQQDLVSAAADANYRLVQTHRDDYHGYAISHFLDVDARFGSVADLCEVVDRAHKNNIRVIFDIVINHSAECFAYEVDGALNPIRPPFLPAATNEPAYSAAAWLDADNQLLVGPPATFDDAVWPEELQDYERFNRRGLGDYGVGDLDDPRAEFRIADYRNRDFYYPLTPPPNGSSGSPGRPYSPVLDAMVGIWSYWIARTDCDGYRVDTYKHVPDWVSAEFTRRIRDFARDKCGKTDFLIVGEVGGSDAQAATFLAQSDVRLLELDSRRKRLRELAGGTLPDAAVAAREVLTPTRDGLDGLTALSQADQDSLELTATTDALRRRIVMTVDDHDGLGFDRLRRVASAYGTRAVLSAAALLLFGPGIPCLYYGTEQALTGLPLDPDPPDQLGPNAALYAYGWDTDPPPGQQADQQRNVHRQGGDRYLREAMFGPEHPRKPGRAGRSGQDVFDDRLPGFGALGTSGLQTFDPASPWYAGIAALATVRAAHPALALGDITLLTTGQVDGGRYGAYLPDRLIAWQRELSGDGEADVEFGVVVVNVDDSPIQRNVALELQHQRGRVVTQQVRLIGETQLDATERQVNVVDRGQTGLAYLEVGEIGPRDVVVITGTYQR